MAGDTEITVVGYLTGDPELRFIPSGAGVANFTVASTPRRFDRQKNEWVDMETLFMRCQVWNQMAENVVESLKKGTRVMVTGNLISRSWEKDGQKHTAMEMTVNEIGPTLRYVTASLSGVQRQGQGNPQGHPQQAAQPVPAASPMGGSSMDPWATAPASDNPPF
jgi:single-strand DNA-binding protein